MRHSGLVDDVRGLGAHDHVCWRYESAADFRRRAHAFLAEGLALGHRVLCVASDEAADLIEDLPVGDDAVRFASVEATYQPGMVVDPQIQVDTYTRLTQQAVADGFTGLRVAADATLLVREPKQRAAFARYEHLVDQFMAEHPFSAMCAYDVGRLGEDTVAEIASMHPVVNTDSAGFRLHAGPAGLMLAGELDLFNADLLDLALGRANPVPKGGEVVVDATGVTFMDHNSLLRLARYAADQQAVVVLRTRWPGARPLADFLRVEAVRVEHAA